MLLAWSGIAGAVVAGHPGENAIHRWGFAHLGASVHSAALVRISELGSLPVLIGGSVLAALIAFGRDRWRALACLAGPLVATVLAEWVAKPLVGRRYLAVLTYPSGSVTAVAALATAFALGVPRWLRVPVAAIGVVVVGLEAVAVVGLRWHEPTDAVAGVALGAGVVLALDGLLAELRRTRSPQEPFRRRSEP